ncbi:MAG: hypothetical protein LKF36_10475 [Lactobacillus sp.]|jgi:hypothetical protein|nr:hypothetical protein [Lactobacillus sp.]
MILPNDTRPETSLYYLGGLIISALKETESTEMPFLELFSSVKERQAISLKLFALTLDWLYLIALVKVDEEGVVQLVHQ